ncbi:hypothetical protein [Amycolatopsis alkalitolerans]|uniref:Uncharacterized protein n=1 Tax=Amycolatopsis alkalitolerans TaxID=2547244 RepID=A0A5C4LUR1_9PSEU|nr:hypothetical protein [Amycolatopsis alkalitolerans]TNC19061.1 hypothetical protein FG385_32870 [Amycolatopsis alkalitolerans]
MTEQHDDNGAAPAAAAEAPVPLTRGRFALFEAPDGGFVCAVRVDGEDDDRRFHIPGKLVKMASMMGGKSPFGALGKLIGGGD